MRISRRGLLAGFASAGAAAVLKPKPAQAKVNDDAYMTLIDLTRCDGCPSRDTPACVAACRSANQHKFPKPDKDKIKDYWPQDKHEDWSDKRHLTDRLTPYNWLFVQCVSVEGEAGGQQVSIPRRCMHCDNPPCVKLCPFGVNKKHADGPVTIDTNLCFGGAKCRTVCPWNVPQRQAGVGIYTHLDPMPVGGGVMYKCDLCRDRLQAGKAPACVEACPRGAMQIGTRAQIRARAEKLAKKYDGFLYGLEENGGTSTVYVSKVPFETLDRAIQEQAQNPKKAMRMHEPANVLEKHDSLAMAVLGAPLVGATAALGAFAATVAKDAMPENDATADSEEDEDHEQAD